MSALSGTWSAAGQRVALVPTMGFFHEGHLSLMRQGRSLADRLVVSLFVNPAQFGPGEDLDAYPRDPERDARLAAECGADALFRPAPGDMYAPDYATWVEVPALSGQLCGASRPGHFRGVCTVVLKLLHIVRPDVALFGRKDWQQLAVIRRMVRDLNVPVRVEGLPIVREADGLAMSSRNAYLGPEERAQAPAIRQGLLFTRDLALAGERDAATLLAELRGYLARHLPAGQPDYLSLVHPDTLQPVESLDPSGGDALLAVAVQLGRARLIDNLLISQTPKASQENP